MDSKTRDQVSSKIMVVLSEEESVFMRMLYQGCFCLIHKHNQKKQTLSHLDLKHQQTVLNDKFVRADIFVFLSLVTETNPLISRRRVVHNFCNELRYTRREESSENFTRQN